MLTVAAAGVLACWLAAVIDAVPPRDAVDWQRRGEIAMQSGELDTAERLFQRVLERAPRSTSAHRGLACTLWARRRHGAAAIQVVLALQWGMPLRSMTCGRLGSLADRFERHVTSIPVVFALPRMRERPPEVVQALRTVSAPIHADGAAPVEGRRMMAAACVAWRARYRELAFQYAKLASTWGASRRELGGFLTCLGPGMAAEIRCAPSTERLGQCGFRTDVLRRMHADRRYGEI